MTRRIDAGNVAAVTNTQETNMTVQPTSDDPMLRIERRLAVCGHCDGGLPMNCTCPGVDEYREDVAYLVGVVQSLVERDIAQEAATYRSGAPSLRPDDTYDIWDPA